MKKLFVLIPILILFTSCSLIQKKKRHYLGTLENVKKIVSHEDSIKIYTAKQQLKELTERIKREKSDATICFEAEDNAEFKGGISTFRQLIYDEFKIPKDAKTGENLIRITIGKLNNLEKVEILNYTDEETKKVIENLFRLKELNQWHSARLFRIPVKQQFEMSIFIENRKRISNNN